MASAHLGVGVIGCGTVGGGVVKLLTSQKEHLLRKTGVTIELRRAADLDPAGALGPRRLKDFDAIRLAFDIFEIVERFADHLGIVWIANQKGIFTFDIKTGRFYPIKQNKSIFENMSSFCNSSSSNFEKSGCE